jgi:hypothetical protein
MSINEKKGGTPESKYESKDPWADKIIIFQG